MRVNRYLRQAAAEHFAERRTKTFQGIANCTRYRAEDPLNVRTGRGIDILGHAWIPKDIKPTVEELETIKVFLRAIVKGRK